MSPLEADLSIREFEIKYDLLKHQVGGWSLWCLLRFSVQLVVSYDLGSSGGNWSRSDRLKQAVDDMLGLISLKPAKYIIKTYTSGLLEKENECYKDVWFDDLLRQLEPHVKIEAINNLKFLPLRRLALNKSDFTTTLFEMITPRLAKLPLPRHIFSTAQYFSSLLQKEFQTNAFSRLWVESHLKYFYWNKLLYSLIMKRVRPEFLFVADPGELALVAAAKENKVTVIELQHGLIDKHHSGYSWTDYALSYQDSMPVPDKLFLFGESFKNDLASNGFWGNKLRVVGSARIDSYRRHKTKNSSGYFAIVFTSQGIDIDKVIQFLQEFLNIISGRDKLSLFIKLHPSYDVEPSPYTAAFKSDRRVTVCKSTESPTTYELIAQADLHLSISSTCHYDAMGLGVITAILPFSSYESVMNLHNEGHAALLSSPNDLALFIERFDKSYISSSTIDYFYKPNAIANIVNELSCHDSYC